MRYYSAQRPIVPGCYPKPEGVKVVQIVNFDERVYLPDIQREAWGYIDYDKPLSPMLAGYYALMYEPG